jgi:hypothetical protein
MSGTGGDVPMRTDSQGPTTLIVAIFFGALTFVVIALRLVARIGILHSVGLDDGLCADSRNILLLNLLPVLILIAAGCTWAFMVCNIIGRLPDPWLMTHVDPIQALVMVWVTTSRSCSPSLVR